MPDRAALVDAAVKIVRAYFAEYAVSHDATDERALLLRVYGSGQTAVVMLAWYKLEAPDAHAYIMAECAKVLKRWHTRRRDSRQ